MRIWNTPQSYAATRQYNFQSFPKRISASQIFEDLRDLSREKTAYAAASVKTKQPDLEKVGVLKILAPRLTFAGERKVSAPAVRMFEPPGYPIPRPH